MKNKKRIILTTIILLLLIVLLFLLVRSCSIKGDDSESIKKTLDFIPNNGVVDTIKIPTVSGLYLKSGELKQNVNFYNPSDNPCYFVISLYLSDDTLIYQSDYLAPDESITDIVLNQELKRGLYKNCRIVYDCFSISDKSPMNGGSASLEINSY